MRSASAIYCFNLEHPYVARSRRDRVASDTQRFHAAGVAWFAVPVTSSRLRRLADPSVAAHASRRRLDRFPASLVKATPCHGPARLRSKGAFHRTRVLRRAPRTSETRLIRTDLLDSDGFAAVGPGTTPFHRRDTALVFQTRLLRLGPRSRPHVVPPSRGVVDAGASLGRTQPFDFCNEFSMVDTRARIHERRPRPPLGVAQWPLPRTMRSSRWPRLPLFLQRRCDLDAPQRATRFYPRRPKELSKGKRPRSCERERPFEACASRSLLVGSFERLLSPAMGSRWDGGPFECCYTSPSLA